PGADRLHPRARRSGRLPPGPLCAGRLVQAARAEKRSKDLLRAGPRPHAAGTGTAVSGAAAGRAKKIIWTDVDFGLPRTTIECRQQSRSTIKREECMKYI